MDILTEAMKRAAQRRAMSGQAQAQPMPEPNNYTVKQTDQMGGQIDHSPENRAFANIDRGYPEMSDATRGMSDGELRSREPSNAELARGGMQGVLPRSSADRLAPVVGALMDAAPVPAQVATAVGEGIANQPFVAGKAVSDAYSDPSLANVTNAGVQTAMSIPTARAFQAGAGVLAGGLGIGAARDAGISFAGTANAKDRPGLSADDNATLDALEKRYSDNPKNLAAKDRMELDRLRGISTDAAKAGNAARIAREEKDADQARADTAAEKSRTSAEYERSVRTAETARDTNLARSRRFSETDFGKVYDKTGGAAAVVAALGAGALDRVAKGVPKSGWDYARQGVEGTGAAFAANSIPLAYNSFFTETSNPEKEAYAAYARELPQGHPRKQEFTDYARGLPDANPIRENAQKEMYDPMKLSERVGISAVEGVPGALTGANIVGAMSRAPKIAGSLPGRVMEGVNDGFAGASQAEARNLVASDSVKQLRQNGGGEQQRLLGARQTASEADELAQLAATREGASSSQAGASSVRPNRELSTTPGQDQPLLPAPAGNPSSKPFIEPGAEYPAPALQGPQDDPVRRLNQGALEYKATAPDQVEAMRRDQLKKVAEPLGETPNKTPPPEPPKAPTSAGDKKSKPQTLQEVIDSPGYGKSLQTVVSPTMQSYVLGQMKNGRRLPDMTGNELATAVEAAGSKVSVAAANERKALLIRALMDVGYDMNKMTAKDLAHEFKTLNKMPGIGNKAGTGNRMFSAVPVGAAAVGAASQSDDPHVAVARALMGY